MRRNGKGKTRFEEMGNGRESKEMQGADMEKRGYALSRYATDELRRA